MNNGPRYSRLRSLRCPRCKRHVNITNSHLEPHHRRGGTPCPLSGALLEDRTGTPIWAFPQTDDWTT